MCIRDSTGTDRQNCDSNTVPCITCSRTVKSPCDRPSLNGPQSDYVVTLLRIITVERTLNSMLCCRVKVALMTFVSLLVQFLLFRKIPNLTTKCDRRSQSFSECENRATLAVTIFYTCCSRNLLILTSCYVLWHRLYITDLCYMYSYSATVHSINPFNDICSKLLLFEGFNAILRSNPQLLIFDIRALWRSGLSARAPECQKLKMVG